MVKDEKLVWRERELSVRLALVIRELDFVGAVQEFNDSADLTAQEAVRRHVSEERDDIQQVWCGVHCCRLYFTKQLVKRGALSPRRTIHVLLTIPLPRGPSISNSST